MRTVGHICGCSVDADTGEILARCWGDRCVYPTRREPLPRGLGLTVEDPDETSESPESLEIVDFARERLRRQHSEETLYARVELDIHVQDGRYLFDVDLHHHHEGVSREWLAGALRELARKVEDDDTIEWAEEEG